MKKILFILMVLSTFYSCKKKEDVQPVPVNTADSYMRYAMTSGSLSAGDSDTIKLYSDKIMISDWSTCCPLIFHPEFTFFANITYYSSTQFYLRAQQGDQIVKGSGIISSDKSTLSINYTWHFILPSDTVLVSDGIYHSTQYHRY